MIRVLVADDEPVVAAGLRMILESADGIEVVAQAADGRAAVTQAVAHRVDVAVLDVTMPVLDGLSAVAQLRRESPGTRVVMLTSFGVRPNVVRALRHNAGAFLLKNCTPGELIAAVRAVHAGEAYLSPAVTRMVIDMVDVDREHDREQAAARIARLSEREREVLLLLAQGMSNAEIGATIHMAEASIKTYVSRILSKLDCTNRVQAALLARDLA